MTRKDYVLIATAISEEVELHQRRYGDRWPLEGGPVVKALVEAMANDNPRFDRERFVKACGL